MSLHFNATHENRKADAAEEKSPFLRSFQQVSVEIEVGFNFFYINEVCTLLNQFKLFVMWLTMDFLNLEKDGHENKWPSF
jgi:hypothetical protein